MLYAACTAVSASGKCVAMSQHTVIQPYMDQDHGEVQSACVITRSS